MKTTRQELDNLWYLYREYCKFASQTQDMLSDNAPDFLGWLEAQSEILEDNKN
jgi:hypothetical protein